MREYNVPYMRQYNGTPIKKTIIGYPTSIIIPIMSPKTAPIESMLFRNKKPINKYIDHTNLKPFATAADIQKLCAEAAEHHFASVCVNPADVALAHSLLKDTDVMTCTVIGFPLGKNVTAIKVEETKAAYRDGCDEFDMVINVGKLKDRDLDYVCADIAAVVAANAIIARKYFLIILSG